MIVIDTNVIAYLFVECEYTESARRILLRDTQWAAPLLWRSELRNTLVKLLRKGLVEWNDALRIMIEAESLMAGGEYRIGSADVIDLAVSSGCSAYDAEFVVLARDMQVPLVTADRELIEKFSDVAVTPKMFLAR